MISGSLFAVDPTALVEARMLSHLACQWPSKAARANLPAREDDGHSNLGWNDAQRALVSHPLDLEQRFQLGFSFSTRSLIWLVDNAVEDRLELDGATEATAGNWVDAHLEAAALTSTQDVVMPYELDASPDTAYSSWLREGVPTEVLGLWFAFGQAGLENLVRESQIVSVRPPVVRCWPHHFDLGTLFVLDEGDPETARSIGVGLSPGDDSYAEPYFYCTPWPAPAIGWLPTPVDPLFWHTEGFVSLICRASDLNEQTDLGVVLGNAVSQAKQLV